MVELVREAVPRVRSSGFQSQVIVILSIHTACAKTLCMFMILWAVRCNSTTIPTGFEGDIFSDWMPFLSPNQQN